MRYAKTLRAVGIAVLLLAVAPRAHAQYGSASSIPGTATDVFSSAGDSGVQARYNKAKKGTDLQEWVRRLGDDDPERRLEAVKSLGDSNDPKAVDYLVQAVGDSDPPLGYPKGTLPHEVCYHCGRPSGIGVHL